jgi:membrane protein required for colicin V production
MSWLDIGVIVVLLLSVAWGAWRGFVHEVLSLAGWILAFLAASLLADPLSESFPANMRPEFRVVGAYLLIFVATLVLTTLLTALITKFIRVSVLQSLDRWLGALFGLLRGLVLIVVFAILAGLTSLPVSADWKNSATGYSLAQTAIQLKQWLPPAFASRLKYN